MFHYCAHCEYKSHHKWVLRRHMNAKHKNENNFEMSRGQNQYHGPYSRAPTTISVGPNGPRAPTIVSVPLQIMGVQYGSGAQPATTSNPHPYVHPYLNNNNQQANT